MRKVVAFGVDQNYMMPTTVAVKSILANNRDTDIYIVNDGLAPEWFWELNRIARMVNCRVIDQRIDPELLVWDSGFQHISGMAYARFFLPELMPDCQRILYIDCDTLVDSDITPLFTLDMGTYDVGCVQDWLNRKLFNSGVMLFDADKWREKEIRKRLVETLDVMKEEGLPTDDQQVLNRYFGENYLHLPLAWNFQTGIDAVLPAEKSYIEKYGHLDDYRIIHYSTAAKAWLENCHVRHRDIWWSYWAMGASEILRENAARETRLVCGIFIMSDQIHDLDQLAEACPHVEFHVYARTSVSENVLMYRNRQNIRLYPAITEVELVALHEDQMDRVDLFIDLDRSRMKSELDTKLPRWTTKDTEEEGVTYDRVFDNLEELALALNEVTEA